VTVTSTGDSASHGTARGHRIDQQAALLASSSFPLSAGRERVRLMSSLHFSIGQSVVYRIGRVNQGPFVIVSLIAQPRHGIRYRIRSQDDDTLELVVDESQLSAT
jgi:hypothetical protein